MVRVSKYNLLKPNGSILLLNSHIDYFTERLEAPTSNQTHPRFISVLQSIFQPLQSLSDTFNFYLSPILFIIL